MSPVDEQSTFYFIVNILGMDHPPLNHMPTHCSSSLSTLHEPKPPHSLGLPQNSFPAIDTKDNNISIPSSTFHQKPWYTIDNQRSGSNGMISYLDGNRLNLNITTPGIITSTLKAGLTLKASAVWPGHRVSRWTERGMRKQRRKFVCGWIAACSQRTKVFIKVWIVLLVLGGTILACMAITKEANSRAYRTSH
ncbi:hypothetical protein BGZ60DRAFT_395155 [Tricladium varicosporioides]|nr:hypothetical protein BGZ60DRAFT_395155 [Hymenoscyphus varicosporioides]